MVLPQGPRGRHDLPLSAAASGWRDASPFSVEERGRGGTSWCSRCETDYREPHAHRSSHTPPLLGLQTRTGRRYLCTPKSETALLCYPGERKIVPQPGNSPANERRAHSPAPAARPPFPPMGSPSEQPRPTPSFFSKEPRAGLACRFRYGPRVLRCSSPLFLNKPILLIK